MKKIIISILIYSARQVVKKYRPQVIGITGSVGKTATKEAVFAVLKQKYRVRKNVKNYNTEIGLSLTILGKGAPGKSPFKWFGIFMHACRLLLTKASYPEMLVLEMGADKPGDIKALLGIVHVDIGIITAIAPAHTETFKSIAGVAKEKGLLFNAVPNSKHIIVNIDDERVQKIASQTSAHTLNISMHNEEADFRASEVMVSRSNSVATGIVGMSCKIMSEGTVTPIELRGEIGEHRIYPALFAAAVGSLCAINMVDVAEGLRSLHGVPGRMRVLPGIKHTLLIDDTYNASPEAMVKALETLDTLEVDGNKFAVLGDMLELGSLSDAEHERIGSLIATLGIDYLVAVGERSRAYVHSACKKGFSEDRAFFFPTPGEAGLFVQERIAEGDAALIKGSRGIHMEYVVKELMAEPERAHELLVE